MKAEDLLFDPGGAAAQGRLRRPAGARCGEPSCRALAPTRCAQPVLRRSGRGACDRPLCPGHARRQADDESDACPEHDRGARAALEAGYHFPEALEGEVTDQTLVLWRDGGVFRLYQPEPEALGPVARLLRDVAHWRESSPVLRGAHFEVQRGRHGLRLVVAVEDGGSSR